MRIRSISFATPMASALSAVLALTSGCKGQAPAAPAALAAVVPAEATAVAPAEAPAAAPTPAAAVAAAAAPAEAKPQVVAEPAGDHAGHDHGAEGHEPGCEEPAAVAVQETGAPGAPTAAQPEGTVYGAGISDAPTMSISKLLGEIDAWVGKKVRVTGLVTDVCPMRGCWFEMAGDAPNTSIRFKVKDGTMVFPLAAKGQTAVAEGVVRKIPLDLETSRKYMAHQAEEKGEPFDPDSVKEPVVIVRLDGTGAVLRGAP